MLRLGKIYVNLFANSNTRQHISLPGITFFRYLTNLFDDKHRHFSIGNELTSYAAKQQALKSPQATSPRNI